MFGGAGQTVFQQQATWLENAKKNEHNKTST